MLLRHSLYYFFARGVPGLVNFAALALYTRLMAPEEFGRYSLVLSTVGLVDVMVFQWLRLVLGRFIPAHRDNPRAVQEAVLALFLALAAAVLLAGGLVALLWPDPVLRGLLAIGVALTLVQAWLQQDLTLASAQLQPGRYGRLMGGKSLLAIIVGGWLAWLGFGAYGPLAGLIFGAVLAWCSFGLRAWRGVLPRWPESDQFRDYVAYGLPLVVTFALGWVIASSDRVIIAWLLDEAAAGVYAVGYDLPQQSLGLVLTIINTAAHPLATRRLEQEGIEAAGAQMRRNGELITTFAFTGAAALVALAPQLIDLIVGSAYRDGVLAVLPWV
ncbi:MAG: lipopolysaccharide biosynthesis protein, partial [Proteobacteria bacterium]|nr:lipopolysaccharide biosynthesis protein [Pseudomonadota bacterium]